MKQNEKIYLQDFINVDPVSINEVINTLFQGDYCQSLITYHERECLSIQCHSNKYRSVDDIFHLCQSYFPKVTIEEVIHELIIFKRNKMGMYGSSCITMGKIKICFASHNGIKQAFENGGYYLQFLKCNKYNSIWSWKELLHKIGIENNEDLIEYRRKYGVVY